MNERIKELALQADLTQAKDFKSGDEVKNIVFGNGLEKFAELIVRECVNIVEGLSPGYDDYRNQIEDSFRRDCVAEIKHKFGVEE
jgi:hypothetical protein